MFSEHRRQQHNYYNGVAYNGGGITPQFLPRPSTAPYFPHPPNSVIQNIKQSNVYKGYEQNDVKPQIDIKLYNSCEQKDVKPHIDIKPNKNSIDVLPSKYSHSSIRGHQPVASNLPLFLDSKNQILDNKLSNISVQIESTNQQSNLPLINSLSNAKEANVSTQYNQNRINKKRKRNANIGASSHGKPFSCGECEYAATTKGNLEIHVRGIHQKLKPFKCKECEYASATKGNLDTHIKGVHNKIKGYQCSQCEYAATTKGNLDQHIRGVHEKLKIFKCRHCDYESSTKGNLDTHMRGVHHKIKAYNCVHCNYSATTKGNLYQHLKGVHKTGSVTNHKNVEFS